MADKKKKKPPQQKPMTPEMMQMENAKLFEYLDSMNFKTIDELNAFMSEHVQGKRIDEIVPKKKGRKTNKEKSDDLMMQAYECDQTQGKKLAQQALTLDPENVRALTYLGDCAETLGKAYHLYKQAMETGAKQLGEEFFKEHKGHFWGLHETRPYMTAKFHYADCLGGLNRMEDAIREFSEMLELNPGDNQGIRYILSALLLRENKHEDYYRLYKQFDDEYSAFWLFNYALYLFMTEGASSKANRALLEAHESNKNVIAFMLGKKKFTSRVENYYSPGDSNEATHYLLDNFETWTECPGTADWLVSFAEANKRRN